MPYHFSPAILAHNTLPQELLVRDLVAGTMPPLQPVLGWFPSAGQLASFISVGTDMSIVYPNQRQSAEDVRTGKIA